MLLKRRIIACVLVCVGFFSVQAFAADDNIITGNTVSTAKTTSNNPTEKINLNTADAEQLDTLKGIGASKAKTIVDYRTKHGPFKSVEDLSNVPGFSKKVIDKLVTQNPNLTVSE